MSRFITRRQFSLSTLATAGAVLATGNYAAAAPPGGSTPKVSSKPYPPLAVTPIPEAFEDRYADLGGVVDLTNGVIWGYELNALSFSNYTFQPASQINQWYLDILAQLAATLPPETAPILAAAYEVAAQRSWRWPTVFEARDAVAKGLFTFGGGGLNLYYGSPLYEAPSTSYGLSVVRWTSSEVKPKVHAFSPADGGTLLVSKTSSLPAMVVSKL